MAKEINYFLILGLSLDPPENNEEKILATIKQKMGHWAKRVNQGTEHPYNQFIDQEAKITQCMLDPDFRQKEVVQARIIKKDAEKDLHKKLSKYRDDYLIKKGKKPPLKLEQKDLDRTVKNFENLGFNEEEINAAFTAVCNSKPAPPPAPVDTRIITQMQISNLKKHMEDLGLSDKTLYDFFEKPPTASGQEMVDAALALKNRIGSKGQPTSQDTVKKHLCGLCKQIFIDPEGKIKYDNYLKMTRWRAVNDKVDELAWSNGKNLEPKMKEAAIEVAIQTYKLTVSEASVYIDNYCACMGYILHDNKIICGLCGSENPVGTINCIKCGKALIIKCPSCGAQNNNSAKSCANCGFDLTKMDEAIKLLRQAQRKYNENSFEEAKKIIAEAKMLWPNHEEILSLEKSIADEIIIQAKTIELIMQDIQGKRFYSAKTKIEQAKLKGFPVDASISAKVSQVLNDVEFKLSKVKNSSPEESFKIFISLAEEVSDSKEINNGLKKFPPKECANFTAQINSDSIILNWSRSPSEGDVEYILLRKENSFPNNPQDGLILCKGKALEYTDNDIKKNVVYCYSVFVSRAGIFSVATKLKKTLSVVEKIKNIRAVGGDKIVTLSWEKSANLKEIKLWKYCGVQRPPTDEFYELVPCNRLDGYIIDGLKNGNTYWFAISAGYILNGCSYFSEKIYFSAVPQKPAAPLQNFQVQFNNEIFQASWQPSEWDVILFYSFTEPDYVMGTIYDIGELLKQYQKIDINLKSRSEADFKINFTGECYIIPGVINASNVILNKFVYVSSVPSAKEVSFDLNSNASEMYVNFTWPKKINRSILVYRTDEYPKGVDDPLAHRLECNKKQYDTNAGIVISDPPVGTVYSVIYTYFEVQGRRIYSEGVKASFINEPQKDIYYSLKYERSGFLFFSKKYTLTVDIEFNGTCEFPAFVIVSKFKSMPLKRGDGEIVCSVNESVKINKKYSTTFEISPLNKDTRLKMFFVDDSNYKFFKLSCKSGNAI